MGDSTELLFWDIPSLELSGRSWGLSGTFLGSQQRGWPEDARMREIDKIKRAIRILRGEVARASRQCNNYGIADLARCEIEILEACLEVAILVEEEK